MTRKEAIRRMECCRNFLANNYSDMGEPNVTAFNMAIKALEQEPVLDKIRAEIVQMPTISFNANDIYKADVLAIIDKYKAESEPQESEEV